MSNRATSFLKRFKTERADKCTGQTWRQNYITPKSIFNRPNEPNRSVNKTQRQPVTKIELKGEGEYCLRCINHNHKKAEFQLKNNMRDAFCQQCSISLVKKNARLLKLSQKNLCLRAFYEAQMEKISQFQEQVHQMIANYFQQQRQAIYSTFVQAKQCTQSVTSICFLNVQPEKIDRAQEFPKIFGRLHHKTYEFVTKCERQENTQTSIKQRKLRTLTLENIPRKNRPQKQPYDESQKQNIFSAVNVSLDWKQHAKGKEMMTKRVNLETER